MRTAAVVLFGVALTACKASVNAEAKTSATSGDGDEASELDQPIEPSSSEEQPPDYEGLEPSEGKALLGARHDVAYKGPPTAKCECMVAALGEPRHAAFEWATAPPSTDANQLVIAISSAGAPCPNAPKDALGPSYWGYKLEGNDVIVVVESAVLGRPITTGAIIPRPMGGGQVYLRPVDKRVPYGRGLDGTPQCRVGDSGAP